MKGWSEEKGRKREIHGTPRLSLFRCWLLLASSSLRKKASHSSLWSSAASKGHGRMVPNILLRSTKHTCSLTRPLRWHPSFSPAPLAPSERDLADAIKQRDPVSACIYFITSGRILPTLYRINHRADIGTLQIGSQS